MMKNKTETILHLVQASICVAGPLLAEPALVGLALAIVSIATAIQAAI